MKCSFNLYNLFDQHTAHLIVKNWFGKAENNGRYFVCSAYRICMNEIVDNIHLHKFGR